MESRKRPHVEEETTITAKKRVLSDTNGSPHVNGVLDQEEPAEGDNLEVLIVYPISSSLLTPLLSSFFARKLSFVE
jgi:hypothetical protein